MFNFILFFLAILGFGLAVPLFSNATNNVNTPSALDASQPPGVILCRDWDSLQPDACIFQTLQPNICHLLPCDGAKCVGLDMSDTWKVFLLNPGTVCSLHSSNTCDDNGMRVDPILFPGTTDLPAFGRDEKRGFHGAEVTYMSYHCLGTGK